MEQGGRAKPFTELEQALLSHFVESHEVRIGLAAILYAAERRDIAWRRLDGRKRLQLDNGASVRTLNGSVTDRTGNAAISLAGDKLKAREAMCAMSLPVPRQIEVFSAEHAVRVAQRFAGLLVLKPVRGNDGKGVTTGLRSSKGIREAYGKAHRYCDRVLIEEQIEGNDFRLLIIGGAMMAAVKRVPACVEGDGIRSIHELIDLVNSDLRRGPGHTNILTTITIDEEMRALLSASDYTLDTVPVEGTCVYLKRIANVSMGGTAEDVTDVVHPDVERMAIDSATAVGLDIAGVDYIAQNIEQSCWEGGGAICEINAGPGLRIHLAPSEGKGRDVGAAIVDWLFQEAPQN